MKATSLLLVLTTTACGFVEIVPNQPTPQRRQPTIENAPPQVPNQGSITLDTGDPAIVEEILAQGSAVAYGRGGTARAFSESTAPVCETPCVANLPYGPHRLRFTLKTTPGRMSESSVQVGANPSVYNYNVGILDKSRQGTLVIAWTTAALGWSLAAGGLGAAAVGSGAAAPLLVSGVAMAVVGGIIALQSRTKVGAGAGVQWTPATAGR